MAHGALGFEIARAISARRSTGQEDDRKCQEYLLTDSNHERVHFALPPFFDEHDQPLFRGRVSS
jgi:hypothetical protein